MAFRTLTVRAPGGDYPILIGTGLLGQFADLLNERELHGKRVLVTNDTLKPLYAERLAQRIDAALITLPDGEANKTLDSVNALYEGFAALGLDRQAVVIALGGGVLGDTAGFAAATYLRGLSLVQVPTSLLSMVDSSVGGKVGVNLLAGKNLVGSFKQPALVIIDIDVLSTLPDVERCCGLAEIIKHGLLADTSLLNSAEYAHPTPDFVARAVQVKIDVVERDPYEQNIRAFLNLGHTFGHAIEAVAEYSWRHGDAVAVGLVGAARLSHLQGLASAELPAQVEKLVREAGLPTSYSGYDPEDLRAAMGSDKKRSGNHLRFVLLEDIGKPKLVDDVPDSAVMRVWDSLRA